MADTVPKEKRSSIMRSIRARHTRPEIVVRSSLHRAGLRFRLHRRTLSGSPDIVFPRFKCVVFVHGCFWHSHKCRIGHIPKSNEIYWINKFEKNRRYFQKARMELRRKGWKVLVIWECETGKQNNLDKLINAIKKIQKYSIYLR